MQKKAECIALDLDGTALQADGTVSSRLVRALSEIAVQGTEIIVVSGRSYATIPEQVRSLPMLRYIVTSNGAAVYNKGRKIKGWMLEESSVKRIMDLTAVSYKDGCLSYEIFLDGNAYAEERYLEDPSVFGLSPHSRSYVQRTRKSVKSIMEFAEMYKDRLDSVNLIIPDRNLYDQLEKQIAEDSNVYITASSACRMEISHADSGKHNGLSYVLDLLHISPAKTVAFGDADNDIPMLKMAGTGISMANGTEGCRQAADRITASNKEDGVAQVIEELCRK